MGDANWCKSRGVGYVRRLSRYKHHDKRAISKFSFPPASPRLSSSRSCYQSKGCFKGNSNCRELARKGCCSGDFCAPTQVLFQDFLCSEKERSSKAYSGPLSTQQDAAHSIFQNGDDREDCQERVRVPVGLFDRPRRCIPSCPDSLGVSQVLRIRSGQSDLRLPVSSLRTVSSSLGLFKGDEAHQGFPAQERSVGVFLPGRFSHPGQLSSASSLSHYYDSGIVAETSMCNKLGKVLTPSATKVGVLGGHVGPSKPHLVPSTRQGREDCSEKFGLLRQESHVQKEFGAVGRVAELRRCLHPLGEVVSSSYYSLDELSHIDRLSGSSSSFGCRVEGHVDPLVGPILPQASSSDACAHSHIGGHDGRFSPRMVWPVASPQGGRCLGSGGQLAFNELEGVESHSPYHFPLCQLSERQVRQGVVRQHHGSCLPTSPRLSTFNSSVVPFQGGVRAGAVIGDYIGSYSHQGRLECLGRQGVESHSDFHRVVSGQEIIRLAMQAAGLSPSGPVCHQGQLPITSLRFSLSGQFGSRGGCLFPRLESMDFNLSLSSFPCHPRRGSEVVAVPRFGFPNRSSMGISKLVRQPGIEMSSEVSASGLSHSVSRDVPGTSVRQTFRLEASRLEVIKRGLMGNNYSKFAIDIMLQQHRESSVRQYQCIWEKFLAFLDSNNIIHVDIALSTVFNFLAFHAKQFQRAYRTLAAYKCALKHPLYYNSGLIIDTIESDTFMKGLFNMIPPKRCAPMPSWSLNDLLRYLRDGPFEPLEQVGWELLTQKTLALFLLASGRRISEIANISRDCYMKDNFMFLKWLPAFKAKHYTSSFQPIDPSISKLESDDSDRLLCPVRAWEIFSLRRARVINHVNNDCFWTLSLNSLSRVLISLVAASRRFSDCATSVAIGPHHLRKFAASYSKTFLVRSIKHEKLLVRQMGCSSISVLKRVYINQVPPVKFTCVLPLGTLFAGS